MMDVSAYQPYMPLTLNDRMIHPSQCKNSKCPQHEIWKSQLMRINNPNRYNRETISLVDGKEFERELIPAYECPVCISNFAKYCCQRCCQQDWFNWH